MLASFALLAVFSPRLRKVSLRAMPGPRRHPTPRYWSYQRARIRSADPWRARHSRRPRRFAKATNVLGCAGPLRTDRASNPVSTPSGPQRGSIAPQFRLYGLRPGRYRVCVGLNTAFIPATDGARFVRTCYPAAGAQSDGAEIVLSDSDVTGIEIRLLPVNPERWNKLDIPTAASSAAGAYRVGPQLGGDDFIAALAPPAASPRGNDRERLRRIAENAERIILAPDEERSLVLRVIRPDESRDSPSAPVHRGARYDRWNSA
jgi:hypothetical protein